VISRRAMMAVGLAALATAGLAAAGPAPADEPPAVSPRPGSAPPGSAPNVFHLLNRSAETPPDTTLRESLRPDLTPPPSGRGFEKMPDGSLRYGNLRVRGKVGAECPDDPFHEAPPLPRRGRY